MYTAVKFRKEITLKYFLVCVFKKLVNLYKAKVLG